MWQPFRFKVVTVNAKPATTFPYYPLRPIVIEAVNTCSHVEDIVSMVFVWERSSSPAARNTSSSTVLALSSAVRTPSQSL